MTHTVPIVTDNSELKQIVRELAGEDKFGIDFEMDALHSFQEKICLMQLTWGEKTVLVDPLAGADIGLMKEVLENPNIEKIFHGGDYDIRSLNRDYAISVRGIFDTMVAAQYSGESKIGLGDLVGNKFGIALDKKYQKADWSQRPLSPEMCEYAAEDTRHLFRLQELLLTKVRELGREDWVTEICKVYEGIKFEGLDESPALRVKGAGRLSSQQLAVLDALIAWRDSQAKKRDVPTFKVMANSYLLALVEDNVGSRNDLNNKKTLPPRMVERYGNDLVKAIQQGLNSPQEQWPVQPKRTRFVDSDETKALIKKIKSWRKNKGEALKLDPGLVMNNASIERLARGEEIDTIYHWQQVEFGEELKEIVGR